MLNIREQFCIIQKELPRPCMLTDLSNTTEMLDRLLRLLSIVAIAYLIVMGLIHRAGVRYGTKRANKSRGREGLPVFKKLLDNEKPAAFWKDESLLHAGIQAITILVTLCSYVILMIIFLQPTAKELPRTISILMGYPNIMATVFVLMLTTFLRRDLNPQLWIFAMMSIVVALASLSLSQSPSENALAFQGLIFLCQSILFAYIVGACAGSKAADFEKQLPMVEVHTIGGEIIENLRLHSASQAECRFIECDGKECLMPTAQIYMIRTVLTSESDEQLDVKSRTTVSSNRSTLDETKSKV